MEFSAHLMSCFMYYNCYYIFKTPFKMYIYVTFQRSGFIIGPNEAF